MQCYSKSIALEERDDIHKIENLLKLSKNIMLSVPLSHKDDTNEHIYHI